MTGTCCNKLTCKWIGALVTIVFAISSNTPKEYRESVREGVLYWNKAFGREQIKVIIAPEGVSAPHPDYNVIQWANWDQAGFAYADAQMDPRTGEILHAQVFRAGGQAGAHQLRLSAKVRPKFFRLSRFKQARGTRGLEQAGPAPRRPRRRHACTGGPQRRCAGNLGHHRRGA